MAATDYNFTRRASEIISSAVGAQEDWSEFDHALVNLAREADEKIAALSKAAPDPTDEDVRRALAKAGTPGAKEAFDALDLADELIERAYGTDIPKEWNRAYQKVARARTKEPRHDG